MYYLHRISHEWETAKKLFDQGYLTIGWQKLRDADLSDWNQFEKSFAIVYGASRGRNGLWRFLNFRPNDTVVVPLYEKNFAIVTIDGKTTSTNALPDEVKTAVHWDDGTGIGFAVHFKDCKLIPREYASKNLQSRMKIRMTNVDISGLKEDVEAARNADSPLNLQKVIQESVTKPMLESIRLLTDSRFERLVKWYMLKIGADRAKVLGKSSNEKVEAEDADVRAEFDALGVVVLIQAKQHTDVEEVKAIIQITKYMDLRINSEADPADDNTYIPWVITAADSFSDEAQKMAAEQKVRLINGTKFAQMLLDAGIRDIAMATENK